MREQEIEISFSVNVVIRLNLVPRDLVTLVQPNDPEPVSVPLDKGNEGSRKENVCD